MPPKSRALTVSVDNSVENSVPEQPSTPTPVIAHKVKDTPGSSLLKKRASESAEILAALKRNPSTGFARQKLKDTPLSAVKVPVPVANVVAELIDISSRKDDLYVAIFGDGQRIGTLFSKNAGINKALRDLDVTNWNYARLENVKVSLKGEKVHLNFDAEQPHSPAIDFFTVPDFWGGKLNPLSLPIVSFIVTNLPVFEMCHVEARVTITNPNVSVVCLKCPCTTPEQGRLTPFCEAFLDPKEATFVCKGYNSQPGVKHKLHEASYEFKLDAVIEDEVGHGWDVSIYGHVAQSFVGLDPYKIALQLVKAETQEDDERISRELGVILNQKSESLSSVHLTKLANDRFKIARIVTI